VLEFSLTAAFLVGLLGGGHCAGMCGGIVGAVTVTLPGSRPKWPFLIAYNFGRIATYSLAGVLAGTIGASSFFLNHLLPIEKILYAVANVMLILLGLYLAGIWRVLTRLEIVGGLLWQRLQPYSRTLLPVRTLPQAILLGTLWGWLPCGLVYSVLVAAIATADHIEGGCLMLAFGLGTLPALLTMGMAAVQLKAWLQHLWVRRISGGVVLGFGISGLLHLLR
jgi:sulfite exporter TauE/SafE